MKPSQFLIDKHRKMHDEFDEKFICKDDVKQFFEEEYLPNLECVPKAIIKHELFKIIEVKGNEINLIIKNNSQLKNFLKALGIDLKELIDEKKLSLEVE